MTGCSAPNCSNRTGRGFKFFRFPANPERRQKWLINCRRIEWKPTQNDRLCSAHFEDSQFELKRADGKKFLTPFAIPTLFDVPNPPKRLAPERKSAYKRPKIEDESNSSGEFSNFKRIKLEGNLSLPLGASEHYDDDASIQVNVNGEEISRLKNQVVKLETELEHLKRSLTTFLSEDQIRNLQVEKKFIKKWSSEAIVKSLELRFALGKKGYNFLRATGYPTPSYSTLNKWISSAKVEYRLHYIRNLSKREENISDLEKDSPSILMEEKYHIPDEKLS